MSTLATVGQSPLRASLVEIADDLSSALRPLVFSKPVTHVYNPLEYAREVHLQYVERFGRNSREAILVGMNPGPWGMAQTGVPFGEVSIVRDWLGLSGTIEKPLREHPARPVLGFDCPRSEVSGRRLWGWARDHFATPASFFERYFVANYCPLVFMENGGRNITPDKLPPAERRQLEVYCDAALRRTVASLHPRFVVGVGGYAESCIRRSLAGLDVAIGRILHPSPASPAANKDWASTASVQLAAIGCPV